MEVYKKEATANGKCVVLNNVPERPLGGLTMYGKSTQRTTTGAQLIPDVRYGFTSEKNGVKFKFNEDGTVNVNGTNTGNDTVFLSVCDRNVYNTIGAPLEDGKYILSGNVLGSEAILQFWQSTIGGIIDNSSGAIIDYRDTGQDYNISVVVSPGVSVNNVTIYPMLNKGETALPFEPYTGGIPSPNPDYPQEIESVGEEVEIKVTGENLYTSELNHASFDTLGLKGSLIDSVFAIDGIRNEDAPNSRPSVTKNCKNFSIVGKTMYIKTENPKFISDFMITDTNDNRTYKSNYTVTGKEKSIEFRVIYNGENSNTPPAPGTEIHDSTKFMISYKPIDVFEQPKLSTSILPTPNGLPGIPVTSGGNYTDPDGQQWVCDTIEWDRASGKAEYVKRVNEHLINYKNSFVKLDELSNSCEIQVKMPNDMLRAKTTYETNILSNKFLYRKEGTWNYDVVGTMGIGGHELSFISFRIPIDAYGENFFVNNPTTVQYILAEPIRTPLTAVEVKAFKSLHTFSPTTIITNGASAGMKVKYYQAYLEAKTNWKATDFFNVQDYNRIKANLNEIRFHALKMWPVFPWEELGPDKTYQDYGFYADEINRMEEDLEYIVQGTFPFQIGEKQVYYDNQPFIDWEELNRIERACLTIYGNIRGRITGRRRLRFSLSTRRVIQC